jgi:hypothetical protein
MIAAFGRSMIRSFIQSDYLKLKAANPDLKVLIREAKDIPPRAFARFGKHTPYPHTAILLLVIFRSRRNIRFLFSLSLLVPSRITQPVSIDADDAPLSMVLVSAGRYGGGRMNRARGRVSSDADGPFRGRRLEAVGAARQVRREPPLINSTLLGQGSRRVVQ